MRVAFVFLRPRSSHSYPRQEEADNLAYSVANKVYDLAGGVGERPAPAK